MNKDWIIYLIILIAFLTLYGLIASTKELSIWLERLRFNRRRQVSYATMISRKTLESEMRNTFKNSTEFSKGGTLSGDLQYDINTLRFDEATSEGGKTSPISTKVVPLVRIQGLCKTIRGSEIIKDFSLDIKAGEVMCLLGNNGSGKTTLINLLTGLMPADDNGGDVLMKVSPD